MLLRGGGEGQIFFCYLYGWGSGKIYKRAFLPAAPPLYLVNGPEIILYQ